MWPEYAYRCDAPVCTHRQSITSPAQGCSTAALLLSTSCCRKPCHQSLAAGHRSPSAAVLHRTPTSAIAAHADRRIAFSMLRALFKSQLRAQLQEKSPFTLAVGCPCQFTFTAPACDEKEAPRWFEPQGCLRVVRAATPQTEPKLCTRWRRRIEPTPPAINHTTNAGKRMPLAAAGIDARRETRTHARLPRWTTHALHAAQ